MQIPFKWHKYNSQAAYFITYFGDIYLGYLIECPNYNKGFFILSMNEVKDYQNLSPKEKTPQKYRELMWEIQDINIIREIIDYKEGYQLGVYTKLKSLRFSSDQKFKRMFVFGAAASTFCVFGDRFKQFRESPLNPPTGLELFDEKYEEYCDKYPGVVQSISRFVKEGKDIEQCMEKEWQQFKNTYNPNLASNHVNIQYYMRELFQDISNHVKAKQYRNNLYSLLADMLQIHTNDNPNERIGIVSFNYDTIIEKFIEDKFRYSYETMNDYIDWDNRNILIFKPHGSCNWGWQFDDNYQGKGQLTKTAKQLYDINLDPCEIYYNLIGNPIKTVASNSWGIEKQLNKKGLGRYTLNKNLLDVFPDDRNDEYFPALLLPYRDKDEYVMPYDHSRAMESFFGQMEELYLIGWKGNEALFNRQLGKQATNLKKIVIANPNAEEVKEIFGEQTGLDMSKYEIDTVDYFEEFVLKYIEPVLAKS